MARPAVTAKLLEQDVVAMLMDVLREVSPTNLIETAGQARRGHWPALMFMGLCIESAQQHGIDLTAQLLSCGYIDIVVAALSAVEHLGVDHVNGFVVYWGLLGLLTGLEGEALDQIEDKVRVLFPSVLSNATFPVVVQVIIVL